MFNKYTIYYKQPIWSNILVRFLRHITLKKVPKIFHFGFWTSFKRLHLRIWFFWSLILSDLPAKQKFILTIKPFLIHISLNNEVNTALLASFRFASRTDQIKKDMLIWIESNPDSGFYLFLSWLLMPELIYWNRKCLLSVYHEKTGYWGS